MRRLNLDVELECVAKVVDSRYPIYPLNYSVIIYYSTYSSKIKKRVIELNIRSYPQLSAAVRSDAQLPECLAAEMMADQ